MIIALAAALMFLFAGGGSLEYLLANIEKPVKEHVEDKGRRKAILNASEALGKELATISEDTEALVEELYETLEDYNAPASDYDALTGQLVEEYKKLSEKTVETRRIMREQMTEAEWSAVFAPDQEE